MKDYATRPKPDWYIVTEIGAICEAFWVEADKMYRLWIPGDQEIMVTKKTLGSSHWLMDQGNWLLYSDERKAKECAHRRAVAFFRG